MSVTYDAYWREVALRFQTYNGLFLELPFDQVREHGLMLPLFAGQCREGLTAGRRPDQIVREFFGSDATSDRSVLNTIFSMLQFAERQIVLFDAVEDAAYDTVHDTDGPQSLRSTIDRVRGANRLWGLEEFLKEFRVRIVLTAHPTQFYPDEVLGIVSDLGEAVTHGDLDEVYELMLQMGKTRFRNHRKPSPEEEARSLLWYLQNVFYHTVPEVQKQLDSALSPAEEREPATPPNIELGFWPGGDRDGNPFVTADTTRSVGKMLRDAILACYQQDLRVLSRRLTFPGIIERVQDAVERLTITRNPVAVEVSDDPHQPFGCRDLSESGFLIAEDFISRLQEIHNLLVSRHGALFAPLVSDLIRKVRMFGFHFAAIDLRQDSRIHTELIAQSLEGQEALGHDDYRMLTDRDRVAVLSGVLDQDSFQPTSAEDPADVLGSLRAAREIRFLNGPRGLHRYIISNTRGAANVLEILVLSRMAGWPVEDLSLEIVPLFETIPDLAKASEIMETLYSNRHYQQHLSRRSNHQTVMLGFSDGTKDGGYVAANWRIYRTKQAITALSDRYNVQLTFFDGRGGPPGRGGGNTHRFYRSLGKDVAGRRMHVTVQGQTISSKYGTRAAARHNIGQIASAGVLNALFPEDSVSFTENQIALLDRLAQDSLDTYMKLRNHPSFLPFLEHITPLTYYGRTNIGSRPSSRQASSLSLDSLRAIPFVGAWSQMKMNVPGYFGLGTAVTKAQERNEETDLREMYRSSLFFRTLLDNSMQSLSKTNFDLTRYLSDDPEHGEFWQIVDDEAQATRDALVRLSGQKELLEDDPYTAKSIGLREDLILPVAVIQQYALIRLRELDEDDTADRDTIRRLEHIVIKSMAATVNASRNAV